MQLTNEERARIISKHIWCATNYGILMGVTMHDNLCYVKTSEGLILTGPVDELTLLLTPLDKITDEDAIELGNRFSHSSVGDKLAFGRYWAQTVIGKNDPTKIYPRPEMCFNLFQFLLSRFYAVPLYPYGKTAIELGIAIDATTLKQ